MYAFLIVVHIIVSLIMISVILLQAGKGAEMGAAFGGSSQTIFGSRGPGTFLSRLTVTAAVIFMVTSLSLAVISKKRSASSAMPLPVETTVPEAGTPPPVGPVNSPASSAPGNPTQGQTAASPPATPAPAVPTPAAPAPAVPPKSTP